MRLATPVRVKSESVFRIFGLELFLVQCQMKTRREIMLEFSFCSIGSQIVYS